MDTSRAHLLGKAGAPGTASLFEGKAGAPGVADTPGDAAATRRLQQWYETGEGAARIRWGTAGDLTRCHRIAAEHMSSDDAWGFCFTGDTEFLTRDGVTTFAEAAGTDVLVLTNPPPTGPNATPANANGYWVQAPIRSYGEQPVLTVTLVRNGFRRVVRATPEHRWYASQDGKSAKRLRVTEVTTAGLRPGMVLAALLPKALTSRSEPSPFGIAAGFTFGDGHCESGRERGSRVDLWGEKDAALLPYFAGCPTSVLKKNGDERGSRVGGLPASWKRLPDLAEGIPYLFGWLAGYFAADGSVSADGTPTLYSARREHLEFAEQVATRLGISTYGIRAVTRVGLGQTERSPLYRLPLVSSTVPARLFVTVEHRRRFDARTGASTPVRWRVESVEDHGEVEEVFCAEVPETETFALAGNVWVHNCQRRHQAVLGRSNPESGGRKDVDLEGLVGPDGKILAGSYEQLTHRLEQEIRETRQRQEDHDPDEEITVVGTYADHVVYSVRAGGVLRSYRAPFRMAEDESSSLALGPPQPVEVEEVVRSRDDDPDVLADVLDGIELATSAAADGSSEPVDAWGGVYYAAGGEEARARDGKGLEVKAGRVLSAANLGRVRVAVEHLLHVLRAAGIETAPGDPPRTPQTDVQSPDATGQTTSPGSPDGKAFAWLPHDLAALRAAARGERDAPPA